MAEEAFKEFDEFFADCLETTEEGKLVPDEQTPEPTDEGLTAIVQSDLWKNILGCQQEGRKIEDNWQRMMLTELISIKTQAIIGIEHEIEIVPGKKVSQGRGSGVFRMYELDDWKRKKRKSKTLNPHHRDDNREIILT